MSEEFILNRLYREDVESPRHYTAGGIECIDAIASALGREGFIAFLRGQVIKYQWRCGLKDCAAKDAAKSTWYSKKLEEVLKTEGLKNDKTEKND